MAMNHHSEDTRSASSSRRLSSNNPFRQSEPQTRNRGASTQLSNSAFEQWVEKNKALIEDSDEERDQVYERPSFPSSTRTGSDSDVNYGRYVSFEIHSDHPKSSASYIHISFNSPISSIHDSLISHPEESSTIRSKSSSKRFTVFNDHF